MRTFKLFPTDYSWWTMADYGSLLDVVERFKPRRVLEFGPGGSTLALIEGGAERVDSCENDPDWRQVYQTRIGKAHPELRVHAFTPADPLIIPALTGQRWDFGFVDGPRQTPTRKPAIDYALAHCDVVACHDVETIARLFGYRFEVVGTVGIVQR